MNKADGNSIFGASYSWLEHKLFPILIRVSEIRALKAVRDAVYSALPGIAIGFFVVFAFLNIHQELKVRAFEAFRGGLSFLAVWVSLSLGARLGKLWGLGVKSSSILAFLLFFTTFPKFDLHLKGMHSLFTYLSQGGLFVAIILSIIFLKSAQYLHQKVFLPRYGNPIAKYAANGFTFAVLWTAMLILAKQGVVVHDVVFRIFMPLMHAGDSLPWAVFIVFLMSIMWLLGLHGAGIIGAITMPLYLVMINENFNAHAGNLPIPYIITPPFFTLCFLGGSGATLPLVLYMWRSKSQKLRKLGRGALFPSLGNINEIIVYGVPIVMNPLLAIPFVLSPIIICIVNYLAFAFNLVGRIFVLLPFCIPSPILAFLATGGDFKAVILILIDFIIASFVWWPFFNIYEKKSIIEENLK